MTCGASTITERKLSPDKTLQEILAKQSNGSLTLGSFQDKRINE
jgi:hypothetical protein